ncbi:hypothetical protein [Virgisporangium aliadipatigenens]|nr:hypothetical protein [Virgisporangium aliadipatigenens]
MGTGTPIETEPGDFVFAPPWAAPGGEPGRRYPREATPMPIVYPTACSPQAWATGTPLLLLRVLLGLEPAPDGPLSEPHLVPPIGTSALHGLRARTKGALS